MPAEENSLTGFKVLPTALSGIGYASKNLSKMVENPASYLVYSRYCELL